MNNPIRILWNNFTLHLKETCHFLSFPPTLCLFQCCFLREGTFFPPSLRDEFREREREREGRVRFVLTSHYSRRKWKKACFRLPTVAIQSSTPH